jgi:hypothetical protein
MQPSKFDELTKALASSTSRRQALRTILGVSIGGLLGIGGISTAFGRHHRRRAQISRPSGAKGNSNCAKWCAQVFGPNTSAAGQCTSDAAHGRGLCRQCGNVDPSSICCNRNGSGYCDGTVAGATCCPTGQHCQNGDCVADCTPNCTGKTCGDNGCGGSCGSCDLGETCINGSCCSTPCGNTCCDASAGETCINGSCCKVCGQTSTGYTCCDPLSTCVGGGTGAGTFCCPTYKVCNGGLTCCPFVQVCCGGPNGTTCCDSFRCINGVCT